MSYELPSAVAIAASATTAAAAATTTTTTTTTITTTITTTALAHACTDFACDALTAPLRRTPPSHTSGVDLSARHKVLGWVGPTVFQRRFFEIDWQERSIAYFNAAETDGGFVRGAGERKEIPMSTIKKLGFPSTGPVENLNAAGRRTAFDIVTPDRTFTLVPLPPPKRARGGRGRGGPGGGGGGGGGLVCLSIFPGCFDSEPPPASPPHPPPPPPRPAGGGRGGTAGGSATPSSTPSPHPDPLTSAPDVWKGDPGHLPAPLETPKRRGVATREGQGEGRPTLTVDDFRVCIASSDFTPHEASLHLARLLLSRNVTEHGTPWEFECPLTLGE